MTLPRLAAFPTTRILARVQVDDATTVPAFTYDPELEDLPDTPWLAYPCRCDACGLLWIPVWRSDRRTPTCPHCVTTDRNVEARP